MYFNRSRYYDALTGTFLSDDPIGFASNDFNRFRYVANQPNKFRDPFGLEVEIWARAADLPFPLDQFDHYWIKTKNQESGLGEQRNTGIPGQDGNIGSPFVTQTETVDHTGQAGRSNSYRIPLPYPVSEKCVDQKIRPGQAQGRWTPVNLCQSFVYDVLNDCSPAPKPGQSPPLT